MAKTSEEAVKVKLPIHLRLTYDDWKENFKGLTRAELGVFYAIRTLDPFGDRELEIDCKALGDELGLHRTSVSRALESLSKKQLIDLEIVKAKVKQKVNNKKLTLLTKVENESNQEQKEDNEICAPTHTDERPRTNQCAHAQISAPTHTDERPRTNQRPEPLPQADSKTPHTIQTYSDLNTTTTDKEDDVAAAEKNCSNPNSQKKQPPDEEKEQPPKEEVEVALQKIADLSSEIKINSTVKKYVLAFWANFPIALAALEEAINKGNSLKNPTGFFIEALKNPVELPELTTAPARKPKKEWKFEDDWTQHPQYAKWLPAAHKGGWAWVQEAHSKEERRERGLFTDWCIENKAFLIFEEP